MSAKNTALRELIARRLAEGRTHPEIAAEAGIPPKRVTYYAGRIGPVGRSPSPEGLRHGPYAAESYAVGCEVWCAARGWVTVAGYTDTPVPWPHCGRRGRGGYRLIVRGDLLRALVLETEAAVSAAWGVAGPSTLNWRRKLGLRVPAAERGRRIHATD